MKTIAFCILLVLLVSLSVAVPYIVVKLPGGGYGVNDTSPLPSAGINHTANWSGGATSLSRYKFQSNLTTCASTGTMTNTSADGIAFSTTNRSNSTNATQIPANCEGKRIGWRFFANDTSNVWNSSWAIQYYSVQNVAPVVSAVAVNTSVANYSDYICINATASDVGIGVASVWRTITFPNGTIKNLTLTGSPACGVGSTSPGVFWLQLNVGNDNSKNLSLNTTWANDSYGNIGSNTTVQQVRVNLPPQFPKGTQVNNTNATGGDAVMFNATLTDDFALSGYSLSFSAFGALVGTCPTDLANLNVSWKSFTANNTNASETIIIPASCETSPATLLQWIFTANDSNSKSNTSSGSFTIWRDWPPQLPVVGSNDSTPPPASAVMFNATIWDDYGISGFVFSWNLGGASCGTSENDSWVDWSTTTGANQCGGTAASCDTWDYTNEATCLAQKGCLWFELERDCYGTHDPCLTYPDSASCNRNLTCSWGNNTNASVTKTIPNACEGIGTSDAWFYANDSAGGVCNGIADACSTFGSQETCDVQSGCLWFGTPVGLCVGTHNPCSNANYPNPVACVGNSSCVWTNKTQWNASAVIALTLSEYSPFIWSFAVNATTTPTDTSVCLNATVTDVGVGVDKVWANVTFPNTTTTPYLYLDNASVKGTCGGGESVYSAFLNVGSTISPPNLTINYLNANDSRGNAVSNASTLEVNVTEEPSPTPSPSPSPTPSPSPSPTVSQPTPSVIAGEIFEEDAFPSNWLLWLLLAAGVVIVIFLKVEEKEAKKK